MRAIEGPFTCWLLAGLLLAGAIVAVVWMGRIRRVARKFDIRLEEQVRERTRIARDLHDSLLQNVQGLMFRLQAVHSLLPKDPHGAAIALELALERGDTTLSKAREAAQDLRAGTPEVGDLLDGLRALGAELGAEPAPAYRVVVEGQPRELTTPLRDEVYRTVREAFRNARRDSKSRNFEVEIVYAESRFTARVRDDGIGLDREILEGEGRDRLKGLQGMREGAIRVGGVLQLWSDEKVGTEIEISVPGNMAYAAGVQDPKEQ